MTETWKNWANTEVERLKAVSEREQADAEADRLQREAHEAEVREGVRKHQREVMRSLGSSDAEIEVREKIRDLSDRYDAEIDAVQDAVGDIVELFILAPNSWTYGEHGEHQPRPMSEAHLFRPDLHCPYRIDVTGDIWQQTAEAMRAMADDLNQAADRLETDEFIETNEIQEIQFALDADDPAEAALADALDELGRSGGTEAV